MEYGGETRIRAYVSYDPFFPNPKVGIFISL
jgi:hypothetical protein